MSGCQKVLLLTSWTNFLVVGENKKMILELESYQLEFEGVSDETWKPERLQGRTCDICARQNFLLVWNKMMPRFYSSLSICLSVDCQRSRQHWPEGLKEIIVEIGSFTYTVQGRYNFQAGRDYTSVFDLWYWNPEVGQPNLKNPLHPRFIMYEAPFPLLPETACSLGSQIASLII